MKAATKFIIQGTVQGVFFRQFVKENAQLLNLTGYVRNLTNGNVEVLVEGEDNAIFKLGEILSKGPKHSSIRHIQREEKKWSGEFKEFKVLRF